MRSNDRLRALWRRVAGPAPTHGVDLDALATRISFEGARALRATRFIRAAVTAGMGAGLAAALAIAVIPTRPIPIHPKTTLLGALRGDEASQRTFEIAAVGPRDGTWMIAAAIGNDR